MEAASIKLSDSNQGNGAPRQDAPVASAKDKLSKFMKHRYMVGLSGLLAVITLGLIVATFAQVIGINEELGVLMEEPHGMVLNGHDARAAIPTSITSNNEDIPSLAIHGDLNEQATVTITAQVTTTLTIVETEMADHPATPVSEEPFAATTTVTTDSTFFTTVTVTPESNPKSVSWSGGEGCTPEVGGPIPTDAPFLQTSNMAVTASGTMTQFQTIINSASSANSSALGTGTGAPIGTGATNGSTVTPTSSALATSWNSTQPVPHGPASTSVLPPVSGGAKAVRKGGNSGNGSSGVGCVVMLVAVATAITYLF